MDTLEKYILKNLLDEKNINNPKYSELIAFLDTSNKYAEVSTYIMRSVQYYLIETGRSLTDKNIMLVIAPDFCLKKAIEYYEYLQNNHELAHECERYGR